MSQFRSSKRAKELKRKAKHAAKEVRKRERHENADPTAPDDDIDWSQAVGFAPIVIEESEESTEDSEATENSESEQAANPVEATTSEPSESDTAQPGGESSDSPSTGLPLTNN